MDVLSVSGCKTSLFQKVTASFFFPLTSLGSPHLDVQQKISVTLMEINKIILK